MRKKPAIYLLVILPILFIGGLSLIVTLISMYSELTGTPLSNISKLNGLLISLPAFFIWIPATCLLSNFVLHWVLPLRRIADQYVSEVEMPGFAESQILLLKILLVFALIFVPLITLGFVL